VLNIAYALLVQKKLLHHNALLPWLLWPSWVVLVLMIIEVLAVVTIGSIRLHKYIGPIFGGVHNVVLFLGAPALANLLLISKTEHWYSRWYVTAIFCFFVGYFLVFFQLIVSEAVFGVDGTGIPISGV
jgi:hypothetical protein